MSTGVGVGVLSCPFNVCSNVKFMIDFCCLELFSHCDQMKSASLQRHGSCKGWMLHGGDYTLLSSMRCRIPQFILSGHDEIKFVLQNLAARALIPSAVRDEPQIYPGRSADVEETEGMSTPTEERGDLLIRNIWKHQTDCILDVRITNLDAPSNIHRKPEAILLFHPIEREKIQTPAGILAKKAGKSYSETTNCMELMMSIAIVRAHIYASEDHDEPNEPITPGGKMGPASACSPLPIWRTTTSQIGQKSRQVENCKN